MLVISSNIKHHNIGDARGQPQSVAHGDRKLKHSMVHNEVAWSLIISSFPNTVTYKTKQKYGYQQCV